MTKQQQQHDCYKVDIIESLEKAINGNGQPGLITTVAKLTECVNGLNNRLDRMDNRSRFSITTIIAIGAVIASVIALILNI